MQSCSGVRGGEKITCRVFWPIYLAENISFFLVRKEGAGAGVGGGSRVSTAKRGNTQELQNLLWCDDSGLFLLARTRPATAWGVPYDSLCRADCFVPQG